jgi:biopolymer transport protein TolQ
MDPAAAVTPESFDLLTIFLRADWVVKSVMIGLAIASLWSWTIIFDKLFRLAALNREAAADPIRTVRSAGYSLDLEG